MTLLIRALIGLLVSLGIQAEPFRVVIPDNADPAYVDKVWNLVHAAYGKIGIEARKVEAPLARIYLMVELGEADAALGGVPENIRRNHPSLLPVPTPILKTAYHVYAINPIDYRGKDSLKGLRLIAMRGSESLKRLLPDYPITWLNEAEQMIRMLELGRADAALGLEKQMQALLAQYPNTGVRRIDDAPLWEFTLHHMLAEQHEDLIKPLDEALATLLKSRKDAQESPRIPEADPHSHER